MLKLNETVFQSDVDALAISTLGDLSSSMLVEVLYASPDCIKIIDAEGRLEFMNVNGQCAMEVDDFAMIQRQAWHTLWPLESQSLISSSIERAFAGAKTRFEAYCPTLKGSPRWWDISVAPVLDDKGQIQRVIAISRDVTDRMSRYLQAESSRASLEELANMQANQLGVSSDALCYQQSLLKEVDLRLRSSHAMTAGLLNWQSRMTENDDARDRLKKASDRVSAVSKIYEFLYRDGSVDGIQLKTFISALCNELMPKSAIGRIGLKTKIASRMASTKEAVALGVVLTEFVDNAVTHGLGSCEHGQVELTFEMSKTSCELIVRDNGQGLEEGYDAFETGGFGLQLAKLYANDLNGTLDHSDGRDAGSWFRLRYPAEAT
ncbi:sensor histidine kinase [Henriciella litoralis]|uniref:sensor histidine kinase n=1 Tax=Henriciella litoralis TaxID=568102 RepID=UPI00146C26F9|nr:PAS domain-containing protein [Henriciella litoralis]